MRRWLILGMAVVLVLAAVAAVAVLNFNTWLDRNREWVAERAGTALGRDVAFDEIAVSIRGGLGARLENLRVGDDPAFSREDFLTVESARVVVSVLPALFGRYEVRRLVLERPRVTVIRTARGFNFQTLGGRAEAAGAPGAGRAEGEAGGAEGGEPGAGAAPPPLLVESLALRDGRVRWLDRTTEPAGDLTVERVDVTASNLSFSEPVELHGSAALLAARPNLEVRGTVGPLDREAVPVDLAIALAPFEPAALREALAAAARRWPEGLAVEGPVSARVQVAGEVPRPPPPGIPPVGLRVSLDAEDAAVAWGEQFAKPRGVAMALDLDARPADEALAVRALEVRLARLAVSGEGTLRPTAPMSADLRLSAPAAPLAELAALLPGLAEAEVRGRVGADLRVAGPLGDGRYPELDGSATLTDVAVGGPAVRHPIEGLSTTIELKGQSATLPPTRLRVGGAPFEVAATVARVFPPYRLEARVATDGADLEPLLGKRWVTGMLEAEVALRTAGADAAALRRSASGEGRVELEDGALLGVNLAEAVLRGVTGVPGLSAFLEPVAADDFPEIFGARDTRLDRASASFAIADQRVSTDDLVLSARDYTIRGRGSMDFEARLDATAVLVSSERLARQVVAGVRQARLLTDDAGRLTIPFQLSGTWPAVRPRPDASLLRAALEGAARGRLEELLRGRGETAGRRAEPEREEPREPAAPEDVLRRGLEGLFGGRRGTPAR